MTKKIVIIGALGYLGTELCKIYSGESWRNKIIALDISGNIHNLNVDFFIKGSITDKKIIKNIFNENKIDSIYHLAAILSSKAEINKKLAYDVNVNGSKNLIDYSLKCDNKINFLKDIPNYK